MNLSTVASLIWQIWLMVVLSWVISRVFGIAPPDVPMGTATAVGAVFGLPALIYEMFKFARKRADVRAAYQRGVSLGEANRNRKPE